MNDSSSLHVHVSHASSGSAGSALSTGLGFKAQLTDEERARVSQAQVSYHKNMFKWTEECMPLS